MNVRLRAARVDELDARDLYRLMKLRSDVFIVEQDCAYPDLDGRDLESTTTHLWLEGDDGEVLACLRVLGEDEVRIGRVCTRADVRSRGFGRRLVEAALDMTEGPVRIAAQAHLAGWYSTMGFAVSGDGFVEDGIPHLPMRLDR